MPDIEIVGGGSFDNLIMERVGGSEKIKTLSTVTAEYVAAALSETMLVGATNLFLDTMAGKTGATISGKAMEGYFKIDQGSIASGFKFPIGLKGQGQKKDYHFNSLGSTGMYGNFLEINAFNIWGNSEESADISDVIKDITQNLRNLSGLSEEAKYAYDRLLGAAPELKSTYSAEGGIPPIGQTSLTPQEYETLREKINAVIDSKYNATTMRVMALPAYGQSINAIVMFIVGLSKIIDKAYKLGVFEITKHEDEDTDTSSVFEFTGASTFAQLMTKHFLDYLDKNAIAMLTAGPVNVSRTSYDNILPGGRAKKGSFAVMEPNKGKRPASGGFTVTALLRSSEQFQIKPEDYTFDIEDSWYASSYNLFTQSTRREFFLRVLEEKKNRPNPSDTFFLDPDITGVEGKLVNALHRYKGIP